MLRETLLAKKSYDFDRLPSLIDEKAVFSALISGKRKLYFSLVYPCTCLPYFPDLPLSCIPPSCLRLKSLSSNSQCTSRVCVCWIALSGRFVFFARHTSDAPWSSAFGVNISTETVLLAPSIPPSSVASKHKNYCVILEYNSI